METFDMDIHSEGDMEFFLNSLETQLSERIESHFILNLSHPGWSDILLDNIEADERYQVPKGTDPFIDCTFTYPEELAPTDEQTANFLDKLFDLLDELEDECDDEGDDND